MKYLYFIVLVFLFQNLYSQHIPSHSEGFVKGLVKDKNTDDPLQYATISIFNSDSALVTGTITAADGTFSLNIVPGYYYAVIQFISYKKYVINDVLISRQNRHVDLGIIGLEVEASDLEEVTVIGERSEMTINLDKKIFNVGKDLSNTGKTAIDILDNIPSVTVDLEGRVSLRGSDNIQILVDGKPSGLVNSSNTDALQTIQGSMIERIEVITNPSARYEAEGMAGIINIVLRKDAYKGLNGTFEATIGTPDHLSGGINLNYRKDKINYFLNYNARYNKRPGGRESYQRFTSPDSSYATRIVEERTRSGFSHRIRGGMDYKINNSNTLSASLQYGFRDRESTTSILYSDFLLPSETLFREISRTDIELDDEREVEVSMNYEKLFSGKDHKFVVITQFMQDNEKENSSITNDTLNRSISFQRSGTKQSEKNYLLQADYIYPFSRDGKFEAGVRGEFRSLSNPYSVESQIDDTTWVELPEYTNHFDYIENIYAAYVQAGNKFGKISVQAGLRAELSDVTSKLYETNSNNQNTYFDIFPSVHTSYQFGKIHSAQLSYSTRIHRPNHWLLNPFHTYSDDRNISTGNPDLKREYTHSVEAGYLANTELINFYSGAYYRFTDHVIERNLTVDSTGIKTSMPINLAERQSFGLESNMTLRYQKWLTLSGNINFFRFITDGTYNGIRKHSDDYSWNTRFNARLKLPKDIDFQAIFFYRAGEETIDGFRKAFYMLNAGISKDVFRGNGTLTFNVQDVLNSRRFRYIVDREDLYEDNKSHWSKRTFTLTLLYRLNQNKKAARNNVRPSEGGDFEGEDMDF